MEVIKGKKSDSYRESIAINGKVIKSPLFKRKTDCKLWLSEKQSEGAATKRFSATLFLTIAPTRSLMIPSTAPG